MAWFRLYSEKSKISDILRIDYCGQIPINSQKIREFSNFGILIFLGIKSESRLFYFAEYPTLIMIT